MSYAPLSMKQGDSIAAYRIVRATSSPHTVALVTATTDVIFGVTQDNASQSNQAVPVAISGIAKVYCNDTMAAGALAMADSSGRAVPLAESTAGVYVVGVCLQTVTATGTLADFLIRPSRVNDVP